MNAHEKKIIERRPVLRTRWGLSATGVPLQFVFVPENSRSHGTDDACAGRTSSAIWVYILRNLNQFLTTTKMKYSPTTIQQGPFPWSHLDPTGIGRSTPNSLRTCPLNCAKVMESTPQDIENDLGWFSRRKLLFDAVFVDGRRLTKNGSLAYAYDGKWQQNP